MTSVERRRRSSVVTNVAGSEAVRGRKPNLGGSYKVWVRVPGDKNWYSPEDISGVRRYLPTDEHLRVLKRDPGKLQIERLPLPAASKTT